MKLRAAHFSTELDSVRLVDSEDWVRVQVSVVGGVFSGAFQASLQLEDLKRFGSELDRMSIGAGLPHEAVLSCLERGVCIKLLSNRMGQIDGTYEFESDNGSFAKLAGSFQLDQSYLPELIASTHELITSLSKNVA